MKLALLTSSRADFGIYLPLIKELEKDASADVDIIAFGTHTSQEHGNTVNEIKQNTKFNIITLVTPTLNTNSHDIANNIGATIQIFSNFWSNYSFNKILVLGDRYEMFAAVVAASPFNLNIMHIHAGETTLGAFDNSFRHSISLMSRTLFVSTDEYAKRAKEVNPEASIYRVGALSIDNLRHTTLLTKEQFFDKWQIDLNLRTILATLHPETISFENNIAYTLTFLEVLQHLSIRYKIVLTLPNADTMGDAMKKLMLNVAKNNSNIIAVQSLGMVSYLTCLKYCSFMIGNTSSGFVEAAYFPKWVINLGNRQKGRIMTPNIINCNFNKESILQTVNKIERTSLTNNCNIYGEGNTAVLIKNIILK